MTEQEIAAVIVLENCLIGLAIKPARLRNSVGGNVLVERRRGRGSIKWCVMDVGLCLAKDGSWDYEPLPSSRDDKYLENHSFDTLREAIEAAMQCVPWSFEKEKS